MASLEQVLSGANWLTEEAVIDLQQPLLREYGVEVMRVDVIGEPGMMMMCKEGTR